MVGYYYEKCSILQVIKVRNFKLCLIVMQYGGRLLGILSADE